MPSTVTRLLRESANSDLQVSFRIHSSQIRLTSLASQSRFGLPSVPNFPTPWHALRTPCESVRCKQEACFPVRGRLGPVPSASRLQIHSGDLFLQHHPA